LVKDTVALVLFWRLNWSQLPKLFYPGQQLEPAEQPGDPQLMEAVLNCL
jgi:hypothetical protein